MSLLDSIHSGLAPKPRRLLLYGTHGIGKSSCAAQSDKPIFIPTEDGLGEIDCAKFPIAQSFSDVMKALETLYSEDHEYKTVALDSLDWLEQLIWNEVALQRSVENIEEIGYGKGYVFALSHWRQFLAGLDALRNERDMGVVTIAHARIERFENPATDPYDRYVPRLHKLASQILQEWHDEILFATYKVYVQASEEGFSRKRKKGVGTGERVLYTTERPSHVAKNRLRLPDELPLDWNSYASFFPKPVSH